jgi:hypothetical protein
VRFDDDDINDTSGGAVAELAAIHARSCHRVDRTGVA